MAENEGEPKPEAKSNLKRIVRLMATDIDGNLNLDRALRKIKGVSFMFSEAICKITSMDPKRKIGSLNDGELKNIENAISNPQLPKWLINRRMDVEVGKDLHIIGATLDLKKREDINVLRRIRSYRGMRHEQGQPCRGQRTRSTFRTNKTVGVSKKAARQGKK